MSTSPRTGHPRPLLVRSGTFKSLLSRWSSHCWRPSPCCGRTPESCRPGACNAAEAGEHPAITAATVADLSRYGCGVRRRDGDRFAGKSGLACCARLLVTAGMACSRCCRLDPASRYLTLTGCGLRRSVSAASDHGTADPGPGDCRSGRTCGGRHCALRPTAGVSLAAVFVPDEPQSGRPGRYRARWMRRPRLFA